VTFTIAVTNTGNVDLADVRVQDPAMPACNADIGLLAANGGSASRTCRADSVQGDLINAAVASGTAPGGVRVEARSEVFVDLPDAGHVGDSPAGVQTVAYWLGHPEVWPVLQLTIGGSMNSRDGILGILAGCGQGDAACALFGQLAATRLNLLLGSESSCVERTVGAADAWLASHPPGSGFGTRSAAWRKAGRRLHERLSRYNRGELCTPPAAP
jgi:hypothetical protein